MENLNTRGGQHCPDKTHDYKEPKQQCSNALDKTTGHEVFYECRGSG